MFLYYVIKMCIDIFRYKIMPSRKNEVDEWWLYTSNTTIVYIGDIIIRYGYTVILRTIEIINFLFYVE